MLSHNTDLMAKCILGCHLRNTEDIGDEFHYLLKCDYFNEKRKTYLDKKIFLNYMHDFPPLNVKYQSTNQ